VINGNNIIYVEAKSPFQIVCVEANGIGILKKIVINQRKSVFINEIDMFVLVQMTIAPDIVTNNSADSVPIPITTPTFIPQFSPISTLSTNLSMAPTDPTTNPTASLTKIPMLNPICRASCMVGSGSNTIFSFRSKNSCCRNIFDRFQSELEDRNFTNWTSTTIVRVASWKQMLVDIIRSMEVPNDDLFVANDISFAMKQDMEDLFDSVVCGWLRKTKEHFIDIIDE
ncbi:hypothetical protein RFI_22499, partial [Reticulomyxa filosa]